MVWIEKFLHDLKKMSLISINNYLESVMSFISIGVISLTALSSLGDKNKRLHTLLTNRYINESDDCKIENNEFGNKENMFETVTHSSKSS